MSVPSLRAIPVVLLASACAGPRPTVGAPVDPAPASSAPAGETFAREDWRAQVEAHLAPMSCAENTYYRLCFAVEDSECTTTIDASARACFEAHWPDAPPRLSATIDRGTWIRTFTDCVSARYEKALRPKKSAVPNCQGLPGEKR